MILLQISQKLRMLTFFFVSWICQNGPYHALYHGFYLLSSYYPHSQWDPWDLTEEPNSVRKVKSERTLEEGKHRDMQVFNVV